MDDDRSGGVNISHNIIRRGCLSVECLCIYVFVLCMYVCMCVCMYVMHVTYQRRSLEPL